MKLHIIKYYMQQRKKTGKCNDCKQCACSRRVHIEGHMNRFEYCHPDNNSDNDSFGSFLSKNRIFCSITRC
jgi:hypothetical protein